MTLRAQVGQVGRSLAALGWFGARSGVVHRAARALDRGLRRRSADAATVAARWDHLASEAHVRSLEQLSWTGLPAVHRNHNLLMTGDADRYWVEWLRTTYFPEAQAGDVLSLGCGSGHLDRILGQCGFRIDSLTGFDISPESTARAQELADQMGLAPRVRYAAVDLNHHVLESERYDFIHFFQALHHIEALEHVLTQCQRALRPDGVLLVNEFVGPSRFQWTPLQVDLANRQLATLPNELRVDLATGLVKPRVERPTVAEMVAADPSEAVRSAEIETELKARFDVVGEWNWGGTLNHLVFQRIAGNFDPADAGHNGHVDRCIAHENALIGDGVLPSDFKVFVARRRRGTATPGASTAPAPLAASRAT